MTTDPTTAREMLDRADSLGREGRRTSRYLVPYFLLWALGSALLGVALLFAPRCPLWYTGVCFGVWALCIALLALYATRHQRQTRPRGGPALALGIVGGTVPWFLAAAAQGVIQRHDPVWWVAGLPSLAAGLLGAACLLGAAALAQRQSR